MKKFSPEVHLSREMRLLDVTMIGIGAMIGAGIFVLTGIAAGVAGPALIVAFVLNGVVALLTAMSYAELGSCYHDAGGGYLWVKEGLPKWNGFLSGWMSWFAHAVACSVYALGFGAYCEHVLREFGMSLPQWTAFPPQRLLAVAVALVFAAVNVRGASETGKIGNLVTSGKILILLVFIGFGVEHLLRRGDAAAAFTPFVANGWGGVFRAMGLTFIAFQGFEVISQCSEEVKNPKKNIPRAVFLSLAVVVPIYLLVAVTALGAVRPGAETPWDFLARNKETALVEVAKTFFRGGGVMLVVGGLISTMSALNATVYSSSRVAFAMGRDRNFPTAFGRVHPRRFTPRNAIVASSLIVILMAVSFQIEDVASAADIMFLLLFLQVNVTLIRLRRKRPDLDRGFFAPLFPWLTMFGIAALLFLSLTLLSYSPAGWIVTGVWIAGGLVVYRGYASKREVEHLHRVAALERLERKEFTILVSISNPATMRGLVSVAEAIARKHGAEIVLLHVVEVPEHVPLRAALPEHEAVDALLASAIAPFESSNVPVRTLVKVSHRISEGIVDTAIEERANFLVLGRQQRPKFLERLYANLLDDVIAGAPCEAVVLHGTLPERGIRRILIPYGPNTHTHLALEVAPAIAEYFSSDVRVTAVIEPGTDARERAERVRRMTDAVRSAGLPTDAVDHVESYDVLDGIVRLSRDADLIVMGSATDDPLGYVFGRSLAQEITENVRCPVLWVKEYEERPSLWSRLFGPLPKESEVRNG